MAREMERERDGDRSGRSDGGGEHYLSLGRAMSGSSKRDLGADCDALA